jgi:hypothetical protein
VSVLPDPVAVHRATIEDLQGRPVLRYEGGVVDLAAGAEAMSLSAADARQVARTYAVNTGLRAAPAAVADVDRDQWTVTGAYDRTRPFWKVRLADRARTDIYVSRRTGEVALVTDARARLLAWLGPIPHWLYPAILRQDAKLWGQVVAWTSLAGAFLTLAGLYLGVIAWRPRRDRRLTPFRGLMAWHHLGGLAAGLLTLTWVLSGMLSVNPWGLLEGGEDHSAHRVAGQVTFGELAPAMLAVQARAPSVRQLRLAPLGGQVAFMADGVRLGPDGRPAPLGRADLAAAGRRAGAVAHQELIAKEDAYYYGHHEPVRLPVWRVVLEDGRRLYLDPASGEVLSSVDAAARGYRWLFEGLHRWDFVRGFDRGAGWAAAMVALLLAAGFGVATGVWLGWRRLRHDLAGLAARN